ncbi:MAG: glycoside hydrolase family 2 TIM barrel-domain containing protein [Pyrinomonadaceae bacterium]
MKIIRNIFGTIILIALLGMTALAAKVIPDRSYIQSLNGNWAFKYVAGLAIGNDSDFQNPKFDISQWKSIPVPSNWELQGFAEPQYEFKLQDGLGLYRRTFSIPKTWAGRRIFLRFDGVAFGFDAWINGKKAGSSSTSAYNQHTFEVTDLVGSFQNAENTLAVKVTTKPFSYEFDVNDDWALSGIFRDVTLFSVPQTYIEDLTTSTKLEANGAADLSVAVELSDVKGQVSGKLIGADNKVVKTFTLDTALKTVIRVEDPKLWTAETPSLYRLQLTLSDGRKVLQTIEERIGLREASISDGILKLNGKPIKLRGVDHHDIDPETGRAITEQQMRRDLELMKRGNINFVRTSHYPPNRRFIELCDELGFYVMDEVSIGKGEENLEKPAYRENILARVDATIARDKNLASVIVWSIGNENPVTDVEMEGGKLAKELDPSRPICYPKIGSYFAQNYQRIPDFVDIYAPHYPTISMLKDYAKTLKRPVIFTEYAHALGLATDRIQDEWEIMQATPQFAGGAIWHFQDQGILRKSKEPVDRNKPTMNVWLDEYRYFDMNGNDGTDGIVYADRTPQTDFWEVRKVYSPVQIEAANTKVKYGVQEIPLTIENRFDFRSLEGMRLEWALRSNDKVLTQGGYRPKVAARTLRNLFIQVDIPRSAANNILSFEVRVVDEKGVPITERSWRLDLTGDQRNSWLGELSSTSKPTVDENPSEIKIQHPNWNITVSRSTGATVIRDNNGKPLVDGIFPHSSRKLTMAEARSARTKGTWNSPTLTHVEKLSVNVTQNGSDVSLTVSGRFPRPDAPEQSFDGGYTADISPNGTISITYDYVPTNAKGTITEAGLSVVMPFEMSEFRWIGQGPYSGYPGKDKLNEFGIFHLNRDDLFFTGNRRQVQLAMLTNAEGVGIALVADSADVAIEDDGKRMLLSHNAVISGLGNKGVAPETSIESAETKHISGSFKIVPVSKAWTPTLVKWFGDPQAKAKVFRPFYHSYDQ